MRETMGSEEVSKGSVMEKSPWWRWAKPRGKEALRPEGVGMERSS